MRTVYKFLSCFLLIFTIFAYLPVTGDIYAEDTDFSGYTEISTKEELNNIRNDLSGKYVLTADILFTKEDFEAGGDFHNIDRDWLPIGKDKKEPFCGVFDGNGFSIKGLQVIHSDSKTHYAGLFGYVKGAVIKNLTMNDCTVNVGISSSKEEATVAVGTVAGFAEDSTITNCYSTSYLKTHASGGDTFYDKPYSYGGGIVGIIKNTVLRGCSNVGEVSAKSTTNSKRTSVCIGGVVGYIYPSSTVEYCFNAGTVSADVKTEGIKSNGLAYTGGIAGCSYESNISACRNDGTVNAFVDSNEYPASTYSGGIVAYLSNGSISQCCNSADLEAKSWAGTPTTSVTSYSGGIAAYVNETVSIVNCYNIGKVIARTRVANAVMAPTYAGGITGILYGDNITVDLCYNVGMTEISYPTLGASAYIPKVASSAITAMSGNSAVSNCFFLEGCGTDNVFGISCTADALSNMQTYTEFDFDVVWQMVGSEYTYPTLKSLENVTSHIHNWSNDWATDGDFHWHECTTDDCPITVNSKKRGYGAHAKEADDNNCSTEVKCTECQTVLTESAEHIYSDNCDKFCNNEGCSFERSVTHVPEADDGDCTTEIKCSLCGEVVTPARDSHTYTNDKDKTCDVCGFERKVQNTGLIITIAVFGVTAVCTVIAVAVVLGNKRKALK